MAAALLSPVALYLGLCASDVAAACVACWWRERRKERLRAEAARNRAP